MRNECLVSQCYIQRTWFVNQISTSSMSVIMSSPRPTNHLFPLSLHISPTPRLDENSDPLPIIHAIIPPTQTPRPPFTTRARCTRLTFRRRRNAHTTRHNRNRPTRNTRRPTTSRRGSSSSSTSSRSHGTRLLHGNIAHHPFTHEACDDLFHECEAICTIRR